MTSRCRRCGTPVLRVHDSETGLHVALEPEQAPITEPLTPDAVVFENHPSGWHSPALNNRRGYPIHHLHKHTESEST